MSTKFRMLIANIYSLPNGPAVSGRVESGGVHIGDELLIVGALGRIPVRVTFIQKFREALSEAVAGPEPIAITLSGIEWDQIRNRDLLVSGE
jgi:translation elongation factor EF-Tu-like GTPase